jgi:hypothetical protein
VNDAALFLSVVLMCMHEVDAIHRKEWEIFPVLCRLESRRAAEWFLVLHAPFFAVLLFAITDEAPPGLKVGVGGFAVVHVALHFFWPRTPRYRFDNPTSRFWIWGSGVAGGVYVAGLFS